MKNIFRNNRGLTIYKNMLVSKLVIKGENVNASLTD